MSGIVRVANLLAQVVCEDRGIGVIDNDYCGPEDEVKIQVRNFRKESVVIRRGDKIAQGLFMKTDRLDFEEVDEIKADSRGGFGSTG